MVLKQYSSEKPQFRESKSRTWDRNWERRTFIENNLNNLSSTSCSQQQEHALKQTPHNKDMFHNNSNPHSAKLHSIKYNDLKTSIWNVGSPRGSSLSDVTTTKRCAAK